MKTNIVKSLKKARQGWSEAFAKYAGEGEDEMMLPDCVDWENTEE